MNTYFDGLITSKLKVHILMRLFLNPHQNTYLRELAREFDASSSHVKAELDQLSEADLIRQEKHGRSLACSANTKHPIFHELHSMVLKALGMDAILESIIQRLGNLEKALLIDDYAVGKDTGIIDLVLVGDIDKNNLQDLTSKTERYIKRKIRSLALTAEEFDRLMPTIGKRPQFILWQKDQIS